MEPYWLTPIIPGTPPELGADRLPVEAERIEALRSRLSGKSPRLLPFFKAHLLISEDAEYCGTDELPFQLDDGLPVIFDEQLPLSHCAEAFFDRLPAPTEQLESLKDFIAGGGSEPEDEQLLRQWNAWLERGWTVALFR